MSTAIIRRRSNPIDHVVFEITQGLKPATSRATVYALTTFAKFCRCGDWQVAIDKLTRLTAGQANILAARFRASLVQKDSAASTVNVHLTAIRTACKIAKRFGLINWDLDVKNLKYVAYRDTTGCGTDGFKAIIAKAKKDPRAYAMMRLMWDCGLRRGEIASLKTADYNKTRGTLTFKGKARDVRETMHLPTKTQQALDRWLETRRQLSGDDLFCTTTRMPGYPLSGSMIWKIVNAYGNAAGIENARPHAIRHAVCTHLLNVGQDVASVSQFMRHKNPAVTMIYDDNRRERAIRASNRAARIG